MPHQPRNTREPNRILIIRPSALGDVCRSVPVLAALRARYPEAVIDWLVQDTFADAIRHHPALDDAIAFPRKQLGASSKRGNPLPSIAWMNTTLRKRPRYDLVIDAQGLLRSAIFARWTGARTRIGYANAQEGAPLLYNRRVHADRDTHAVDRMLTLARVATETDPTANPATDPNPTPNMTLHADPTEFAWVATQFTNSSVPGPGASLGSSPSSPSCPEASPGSPPTSTPPSERAPSAREGVLPPLSNRPPLPDTLLAPTSRWPAKQWPAERFADLARRLLAHGVPRIIIAGGPGEQDQIRPLLDWADGEPRATNLVGQTSIARLMALIARAALVVANDSAALHMAVGFHRPLVALFGPTRIHQVGPYRREHDVIQHTTPTDPMGHKDPANVALMHRITTDEVLTACLARHG